MDWKNHFSNIGKTIKLTATVLYILGVVAAAFSAMMMVLYGFSSDAEYVLYGFIALVTCPCVGIVAMLLMYGFGELIDKTCENAENTKKLLEVMTQKSNGPAPTKANTPAPRAVVAPTKEQSTAPAPAKPTVKKDTTYSATWVNATKCPSCGYEQPGGRTVCWQCGVALDAKPEITHQWKCDGCENMRTQTPCEHCGKE